LLLTGLVVAIVCIAIYLAGTQRDTDYVSSTTHPDGSSTVLGTGGKLRHHSNGAEYQRALDAIVRHDFEGAERLLRSIVDRTPDEFIAWQLLGTALFEQRRYEESGEAFELILRADPHFYPARCGLGAIDRVMGRYSEAAEQYSLALKESPTDALSYYGRGVSYFHSGKHAEARADLKRVLELLPPTSALAVEAGQDIERL
jgi:tetratricopeptide (TPR) repeat protein